MVSEYLMALSWESPNMKKSIRTKSVQKLSPPVSVSPQDTGSIINNNMIFKADTEPSGTGESFQELGVTGLKVASGYIFEEFLPELKGQRGIKIYTEMRDNDATIGAILFALKMILRKVKWNVCLEKEEGENEYSDEQMKFIEFVEQVFFKDMDHPFEEFISEILSMLVYGWSYFEIVWKLRKGYNSPDRHHRSKYNDGKIGIKKIAIRSQDSLDKWEIDEKGNGDILGMWQVSPFGGGRRFIPIDRALHFRTESNKNNPEGRSALRNAYRSYYFKKKIDEIEAVAIERELNGLPVAYIPNETLTSTKDTDKATVEEYKKIVRDVRLNSQAGVVLPSDTFVDKEGSPTNVPLVKLELLSTNGTRAIDTTKVKNDYRLDICRTVLADFVMLGANERGSYALSSDKTELFIEALKGWLNIIASVLNYQAIPKLWEINNYPVEMTPYFEPSDLEPEDLQGLGDFIEKLSGAGMMFFPDDDLESTLRKKANLPAKNINKDLLEEELERQMRIHAKFTSSGEYDDNEENV